MREGSEKHPDHHGLWWQSSGTLSLGDGADCGLHSGRHQQQRTKQISGGTGLLNRHFFLSTFCMPSMVLGSRDPKLGWKAILAPQSLGPSSI